MINIISYVNRKLFFEPLTSFKSDDPLYINIEDKLEEVLNKNDPQSVKLRETFFNNLSRLHSIYKNKGNIDIRIPVFLFTPFWIVGAMFFLVLGFHDGAAGGPIAISLFFAGRCIYVVYNVVVGYREIGKYTREFLSESQIIERNPNSVIWRPILESAERIGVVTKNIQAFYRKENHFIPSITDFKPVGKKLIVITIPRNLFMLATSDPELYRAIIAHEMSHIDQGDSGIWLFYSLDQRYAFSLYDLFANLVMGKQKRLLRKYKFYNSSAEYLADLGSFIITKNTQIFEFLKGPYIADEESDFHPSKFMRLFFLKAVLYKQLKLVYKEI